MHTGVVAGETRDLGQKNGGKGWEAEEPDVVNQPPRGGPVSGRP